MLIDGYRKERWGIKKGKNGDWKFEERFIEKKNKLKE